MFLSPIVAYLILVHMQKGEEKAHQRLLTWFDDQASPGRKKVISVGFTIEKQRRVVSVDYFLKKKGSIARSSECFFWNCSLDFTLLE